MTALACLLQTPQILVWLVVLCPCPPSRKNSSQAPRYVSKSCQNCNLRLHLASSCTHNVACGSSGFAFGEQLRDVSDVVAVLCHCNQDALMVAVASCYPHNSFSVNQCKLSMYINMNSQTQEENTGDKDTYCK
jgi:hypothetical protein